MKLIPLTQGQFAKVSDHRYEYLMQWKWCVTWNPNTKSFYAIRGQWLKGEGKKQTIIMHRLILDAPKGVICDHINHDTLDNQDENLRMCTSAQNNRNRVRQARNKSGYIGVYFKNNKWTARITKGEYVHLGQFENVVDAARAYDEAAKKLHGEFASLNFPESKGA